MPPSLYEAFHLPEHGGLFTGISAVTSLATADENVDLAPRSGPVRTGRMGSVDVADTSSYLARQRSGRPPRTRQRIDRHHGKEINGSTTAFGLLITFADEDATNARCNNALQHLLAGVLDTFGAEWTVRT